jgi:hypothetical protein
MNPDSADQTNDFDEILNNKIHYFLFLKRLYELQIDLLKSCEGRTIKNDLIYQQMLFASLDGLFVRLHNFQDELILFLNILKSTYANHFKRSNRNGLSIDPKSVMNFDDKPDPLGQKLGAKNLTQYLQQLFDEKYDQVFPGVRARGKGQPNHSDFDLLSDALRNALKPICDHRDTVVAHWDDNQKPATLRDLKTAMSHIEELLKNLYYISKLGNYSFELGGFAANIKQSTKELAILILGEYRTRRANIHEMDTIYMMGFDVWTEGQDGEAYLNDCRSSPKYARGTGMC